MFHHVKLTFICNPRLKRASKIAEFLQSLDKDLPPWAEIVPETFKDPDLETHDGQAIVNSVYAPLLWFGKDSSPPSTVLPQKPPEPPAEKEEIAISCKCF